MTAEITITGKKSLDFRPHAPLLSLELDLLWQQQVSDARRRPALGAWGDRLLFRDRSAIAWLEPAAGPASGPVWQRVERPIADGGPALVGGPVVVTPDGAIYRWTAGALEGPVWETGRPGLVDARALDSGRLLIRIWDDDAPETCVVDPASAAVVWSRPGMPLDLLPTAGGDRLLTLENPEHGPLRCHDAATGEALWEHTRSDVITGLIAVVNGQLWFGVLGGRLVGLDVTTGAKTFDRAVPMNLIEGTVSPDGHLHQCTGLAIRELDLANGGEDVREARFESRKHTTGSRALVVPCEDGRVIFSDMSGQIWVVEPDAPARPRLIHQIDTRKRARRPRVITHLGVAYRSLYVLASDGLLTCLGAPR